MLSTKLFVFLTLVTISVLYHIKACSSRNGQMICRKNYIPFSSWIFTVYHIHLSYHSPQYSRWHKFYVLADFFSFIVRHKHIYHNMLTYMLSWRPSKYRSLCSRHSYFACPRTLIIITVSCNQKEVGG